MRVELKPHPDTPSEAVGRLRVDVERDASGGLLLRYLLGGWRERLVLPAKTASVRADGLWKHTCFEAFVGGVHDEAYYELNFAPSTQWAAYRFDRYREGMRIADDVWMLTPEVTARPDNFELATVVTFAQLPGSWRVALSAVIEEMNGAKSYWALNHPPGKPDFHHVESFVLTI